MFLTVIKWTSALDNSFEKIEAGNEAWKRGKGGWGSVEQLVTGS